MGREDKDDQYRDLFSMYKANYTEKVQSLIGTELYDFLVSCKTSLSEGATYNISGFKEFSIYEVRARYFLWPLRSINQDADYELRFGPDREDIVGYKEYKRHANGSIYERVGL